VSAVFVPLPGSTAYYRCPQAEIDEDADVVFWLGRYFDSQRMNVQHAGIDNIPAIELQAFRVISSAIADTQRRDNERRAKANEKRGQGAGRVGGRATPSPRPRAPRRSGRSRR